MPLQNTQVFISYKKKNKETPPIARAIRKTLEQTYGYQVFLDTERIPTAAEWEKIIYTTIRKSDVLLVLLDPETADSNWVQREIDVARGCNVAILPLAIVDSNQLNIIEAAEKLAIGNLQYSKHFRGIPEDFEQLVRDIERLKKITRDAQKAWIEESEERWRVRPPTEHIAKYRTFPLDRYSSECKVHLAVGDILKMGYFDVIVNSENDYMQMARYYEQVTLSAKLRIWGSLEQVGRIIEDTLQEELNAQIAHIGRPIPLRQVIVTQAGHAKSRLRKKARFIFHAASVRIAGQETSITITPVNTDTGIQDLMYNSLTKVLEVNEAQGIISTAKKKGKQPADAASYKPIESIIFPIFGTGLGGRSVTEVAPAMARGIHDFLTQHCGDPHFTLKDIYVCAYSSAEIEVVSSALDSVFIGGAG